jgi:hypothetical protein
MNGLEDYPRLLEERLSGLEKFYKTLTSREAQDIFLQVVKEIVQDHGPIFTADIANKLHVVVDLPPKSLITFLSKSAPILEGEYDIYTIPLADALRLVYPNYIKVNYRQSNPLRSHNQRILYETERQLTVYIQERTEDLGGGAIKGRFSNPFLSKEL